MGLGEGREGSVQVEARPGLAKVKQSRQPTRNRVVGRRDAGRVRDRNPSSCRCTCDIRRSFVPPPCSVAATDGRTAFAVLLPDPAWRVPSSATSSRLVSPRTSTNYHRFPPNWLVNLAAQPSANHCPRGSRSRAHNSLQPAPPALLTAHTPVLKHKGRGCLLPASCRQRLLC